jgi:hypothetical protein
MKKFYPNEWEYDNAKRKVWGDDREKEVNNLFSKHKDVCEGVPEKYLNEVRMVLMAGASKSERKERCRSKDTDCGICLEALDRHDVRLGCGHIFHKSCIEKWTLVKPCPTCKFN